MKTKLTLLLIVIAPLMARPADELSTSLQKGLFEEEANQNLPAAIKAYESLLAASDEQRKLAATALFRLGECYRKLGKTNDAVAQYQRVIRDYADQSTLVTLSRQNLAGLGIGAGGGQTGRGSSSERSDQRQLLEAEIQLVEQDISRQRELVNQKLVSENSLVPKQRELLGLRRQLAALNERSATDAGTMEAGPEGEANHAARNQLKELLAGELKIAEQFAAEQRKRIAAGTLAVGEEVRFERDVLGLKRQLIAVDGLITNRDRQEWRNLMLQEIALAEKAVVFERQKLDSGKSVASEVARLQRDVLILKRDLVAFDNTPVRRNAALGQVVPVPSVEAEELARTERILAQLEGWDLGQVRRLLPTVAPDADFEHLDRQVVEAQEKSRQLTGAERDEWRKREAELADRLKLRFDEIKVMLTKRAEQLRARLERQNAEVRRSQSAGADNQTAASALRAEAGQARALFKQLESLGRSEVRRVLPTVAPDGLLNSLLERHAEAERNLASQRTLMADDHPTVKQAREVLKRLDQQVDERIDGILKGLSIKAAALGQQAGTAEGNAGDDDVAAPTDEEEKEIRRIQALIRNSPDLINAAGQDWTPLHQAAIKGQLLVARYLLENGANVNQMTSENNGPALLLAASRGHKSMVELLIAKGAIPSVKDQRGTTALHEAAAKGFASVVDVLLASKAEVNLRNSSGETPLHLAVNSAQTAVIDVLFKHGADINAQSANGWTPLHFAATRGDAGTIAVLLQNKADVNVKDRSDVPPLAEALTRSGGTAEAVRVLLENGARTDFIVGGDSPVQCAVARNSIEMVKLLLQHKAAPDLRKRNGCTPLQSVVVDGRKAELIPILIQAGANPNALLPPSAMATVRDSNTGGTHSHSVSRYPILSAAIVRRDLPQVEALLANGADVNAVIPDNYQSSVLMHAVTSGSEELLGAVLQYKPDLELRTRTDGRTALHQAADNGNLKAVESLIKAGAKVDAADNRGWAPLHLAAQDGNIEIAKALLRAEANPNVQALDGTLPLSVARRTSGSTVLEESVRQEFSRLLLEHGADESLLRRRYITVTRRGRNYEQVVFIKGTNDFNRHSLYELMAGIYIPNRPNREAMAFPDLKQIAIERADGKSGARQILVNLEARARNSDCTNDLWLEWGDLVEIRETEHPLNVIWQGLDGTIATNISRCLGRKVNIIIKGHTNQFELVAKAGFASQVFGPDGRHLNGYHITHESFRLASVLQNSGLLLTSSDLSRVKVSRRDPQSGQRREWTVSAVNLNNEIDLWLQDGDEIEVPEKDPNAPRTVLPAEVQQLEGFRSIPSRTQRQPPGQ